MQERLFTPVGSHSKIHFDGRVIAATNQSIEQLRMEGKFRDDFYYRLCSDCIVVPSLQQRVRENPVELDELIAYTVKRITGQRDTGLNKIVKEIINKDLGKDYHWPGNVRELAQCIRRVIIRRSYQGDVTLRSRGIKEELLKGIESGTMSAHDLLAAYCNTLYSEYGTYQDVARITGLDRRTVKKQIVHFRSNG